MRYQPFGPRQPYVAWLLVATLVGAVALSVLLGVPAMASGSSSATSPEASRSVSEVPVSGTSAVPRAVAPDVGANTRANASLTPLELSPSVYHARWWGIQLYGQNLHVDKLEQVGAGWLRVPLAWAPIEPVNTTPEYFQWPATLDAQLAQASAKSIQVILTLKGNPSWAAQYPSGPIDAGDMPELVQFMEAAVARYGAPPYNIKYWEIYNEPDNERASRATFDGGGYGYFGQTPGKYVYILSSIYGPMKTVDPEAQIVFGGLAYDGWESGFAEDFVDRVLEKGGGPYFDVMNFHYFPNFSSKWEQYGIGIDIIGKANYLRNIVTSYGVYKSYICTETCQWSNESEGGSDELQSRYVVQVFARSKEADLDMTNWFWLLDDRNIHKCGLYDLDRKPKPAHDAFRTLSRQLYSAQYVRSIDPGETGSSQIEAYHFLTPDGSRPIIVAWSKDESTHQMSLETDQLIMVDKYGNGTTINDGDDGVVDGHVQVNLGPSPVYLRFQREYSLTVNIEEGQGVVIDTPGNPYYDGEVATLEPNPDTGWEFSQWSGPNAGEVIDNGDGTWSLTMNGNKTVSAAFTLKQHILTTDTIGEGAVSHTPGNPYTYGDVATLEPIPAVDWTFNGWTGADAQDLINNHDDTWSLTMDGDKAVTARFIRDELAVLLAVDIEGQGRVIDTPGNPYLTGEEATLEPSPDRGWSFDDWSGPDAGDVVDNGDGTWNLTMDGDKTLTARFNEKEYFVTVTISGNGDVQHTPGGSYLYGKVATLKPIPAADHRFAGWSGPDARDLTYNDEEGTWSLTMDEDKAVTARFAKQFVFLPLVPVYYSH
jgi:hypothetical protein